MSQMGKICYQDCIKSSLAAFKTGLPLALVGIQGFGSENSFEFVFTSYLSVPITTEWVPPRSHFFCSSRQNASVFVVRRVSDGSREACIQEISGLRALWGPRGVAGGGSRKGIYILIADSHFCTAEKLTQHYKPIILQFKKIEWKKKKNQSTHSWSKQPWTKQ